jgi:hypothetical protein
VPGPLLVSEAELRFAVAAVARCVLQTASIMARLGSVLAHIVSVASLSVACSDEGSRGTCYGNPAPITYVVPIGGDNEAGAGGAESGAAGAGGAADLDCAAYCAPGETCQLTQSAGEVSALCMAWPKVEAAACPPPGVAIGRRPEGLLAPQLEQEAEAGIAAFFARVAHLEAASIHAFVRLGRELRGHGAEPALVRRTRQAARDEARHATHMSRLARRHGARVPRARVPELRSRSLFELARENEVEGCVRETFGAAVASWQAEHAATPELRGVFASIAGDEIAHAELAWQLRAWLRPRLNEAERTELDTLQRTALAALSRELAVEPPTAWRTVAGLPNAATASRMLALLAATYFEQPTRSAAMAKSSTHAVKPGGELW